MSLYYSESNLESTIDLFKKKIIYKRTVKDSAPDSKHIVDFSLGEKKLYGKVNSWFSPIYLHHPSRLKGLKNSDQSSPLQAFNFVADLFNEMALQFEIAVKKGQIDPDDEYLSVLKPYRAFEDPRVGYAEYKQKFFKTIDKRFRNHNILVEDFEGFMEQFTGITKRTSIQIPLTFSGYIKSDMNHIMASGLAIEIADLSYDNDDEKIKKLIKSKNWKFFVNACNKYGFIIDQDIPWRIICDIKAKEIRPVLQQYYLTPTQLFKQGYSPTSAQAFSQLPSMLLELYNTVRRPKIRKLVKCGSKNVYKKIIPRTYTLGDLLSVYNVDYFVRIYMNLRLLEEHPEMTPEQRKKFIIDIHKFMHMSSNYSWIELGFEQLINKPFDKRYSMTYNMNVLYPVRKRMLEEKLSAYSVDTIQQTMMSY